MGLLGKLFKPFKKIFKGIGKAFKKIWKSPFGKILMIAAAVYTGGAALAAWAGTATSFGAALAAPGTALGGFGAAASKVWGGIAGLAGGGAAAGAGAGAGAGASGFGAALAETSAAAASAAGAAAPVASTATGVAAGAGSAGGLGGVLKGVGSSVLNAGKGLTGWARNNPVMALVGAQSIGGMLSAAGQEKDARKAAEGYSDAMDEEGMWEFNPETGRIETPGSRRRRGMV